MSWRTEAQELLGTAKLLGSTSLLSVPSDVLTDRVRRVLRAMVAIWGPDIVLRMVRSEAAGEHP